MKAARFVVLPLFALVPALGLAACDDVFFGKPQAAPPPIPDALTLCDIEDLVFTPKCVTCHTTGGTLPDLTAGAAASIVGGVGNDGVTLLVAPGDPTGSLLYRKVTGTQSATEGDRMPLGGQLESDLVVAVQSWIEQGARVDCGAPSDAGPVDGGAVDAGCTPDCTGKQCGDDGCGNADACGGCVDGNVCNASFQCAPPCVPVTCDELGLTCGTVDDGCGTPLPCGDCNLPQTCGGGALVGACGCTSSCTGKDCGDDGCGGSCGNCGSAETCSATGTCVCAPSCTNDDGSIRECSDDGCGGFCGGNGGACAPDNPNGTVCNSATGACAATCTPASCLSAGVDCDQPTKASDGCGGTLTCGSCSSPETCGGSGEPNVCGCTPATCFEAGATCGTIPDGCGATLDCGTCAGTATCDANNSCVCTRDCAGAECGPDGCGGTCGACDSPPAPTCLDATTLRTFSTSGTCGTGTCTYGASDAACAFGCTNGACDACVPSCPSGAACGDDGCGGTCGAGCSGGQQCDANNQCFFPVVSLANDIQPLFSASCAANGCHGGAAPKQGLALTSASVSYAKLVGVFATETGCSTRKRVDPGSVSTSYIVDKLTGTNLCFGSRMPVTGGAWTQAEIDLVRAWIGNGAPNN